MKLSQLFLKPLESRLYCEWNVNFPKYLYNPMEDDLSVYNSNRDQITEVYITEKEIDSSAIPGFEIPKQFVMNKYEWSSRRPLGFEKIIAYKTSSQRTFFIPDLGAYVKTHFSGRISSNYRDINASISRETINLNAELIDLINSESWPMNTAFLPEYGATTWNNLGCIYRSISSYPKNNEQIIPLYSLCGLDANAKDDLPLFVQIAHEKNIESTTFLLEEIISPLIESWKFFVFNLKRKITCHGQNILVGFDQNLKSFNITHRDLQTKKYHSPLIKYEVIEISKLYDFHMGWLLFDEIKHNNSKFIDSNEFTQRIKNLYKSIVGIELCDYRVYERGIGNNKETYILKKKPKYR